jgi:DNA-directed RNA polymerase specialized sigma24 family protein
MYDYLHDPPAPGSTTSGLAVQLLVDSAHDVPGDLGWATSAAVIRAGDAWARVLPSGVVARKLLAPPGENPAEQQLFWSGVARLPDDYRRILVLSFVDGMDNAELSQIFECSRSRMAVLVRRAVRALRSVLASQAD